MHRFASQLRRMIRQSVSGLAKKIMRPLNNGSAIGRKNRIPLLLVALVSA
jgi:hypothetical protein